MLDYDVSVGVRLVVVCWVLAMSELFTFWVAALVVGTPPKKSRLYTEARGVVLGTTPN